MAPHLAASSSATHLDYATSNPTTPNSYRIPRNPPAAIATYQLLMAPCKPGQPTSTDAPALPNSPILRQANCGAAAGHVLHRSISQKTPPIIKTKPSNSHPCSHRCSPPAAKHKRPTHQLDQTGLNLSAAYTPTHGFHTTQATEFAHAATSLHTVCVTLGVIEFP